MDVRIARQLAYHLCALDCDDPEYIKARNAILDFANRFHRADECGILEAEIKNAAQAEPIREENQEAEEERKNG